MLCVLSSLRRDWLSFVALETIFNRSASSGVQEANYSQSGLSASGSNSARAALKEPVP